MKAPKILSASETEILRGTLTRLFHDRIVAELGENLKRLDDQIETTRAENLAAFMAEWAIRDQQEGAMDEWLCQTEAEAEDERREMGRRRSREGGW